MGGLEQGGGGRVSCGIRPMYVESRGTGGQDGLHVTRRLVSAGAFDRVFLSATSHVKQDKGVGSMLVPGSTPTLPSHKSCHGSFWCVRPSNRRRMAALGADGRAQPWCLTAQSFIRWLGRTTDVKKGVIYAGPSMRGIGRMCLDSVGMHDVCDSCMHLGTCRRLAWSLASCKLEVILRGWWP